MRVRDQRKLLNKIRREEVKESSIQGIGGIIYMGVEIVINYANISVREHQLHLGEEKNIKVLFLEFIFILFYEI